MLKVESLGICPAGLTAEEKLAPAKVEVLADGTPIAKGNCIFTRDGMNMIGSVSAAGNVPEGGVNLDSADKLELSAKKTVARTVAVKKGAKKIETGVHNVAKARVDGEEKEIDDKGVITIDEAADAMEVEVELDLEATAPFVVAGNAALAHKLVLDEGPIHFSMIVEAEKSDHAKHSKTRCTVRGRKPWKNTGDDGPLHIDPEPVE